MDENPPDYMTVSDSSAEHYRTTGQLPLADKFHFALNKYAEINTAYRPATDPEAYQRLGSDLSQELQDVFIDPQTGEPLPEAEILRNLDIIITSLVSKVDQVETLGLPRNSDQQSREEVQAFLDVVKSILSHPLDRQQFDKHKGTIQEVIIDPRRITDTLLANLGLKQFIPEKGTRQADKVARREESIHSIKSMLPFLEPINAPGQRPAKMRHFRLMRMTVGSSEGYVLGTQTNDGRKVLFKSDLHGTSRRIQHIDAGYRKEIEILGQIEGVLRNALANPDDWGNFNDADLMVIRSGLIKCVNGLEKVTNPEKVALREAIKKALTFRRGGGAENPDVRKNLEIALDQLAARVNGIEGTSSVLNADKIKLDSMIAAQTKPLEAFLAQVNDMHQSFKLIHPEMPISQGKKAEIIKNLQALKDFADGQKFEPYLSFGRKFSYEISKVIESLKTGDRVNVAQDFMKAYLIAKLEKAYKDILDVYEKISLHPDLVNPQDVTENLLEIEAAMRNHDVAPGIKTNEYDAAYIQVYHLLNSLKKRIREITPPAKQKPQLAFDFDTQPQPVNSKPPEIPRTRIDQVLDLVEKIPKVGRIVSELRSLFNLVFRVEKPAPTPARRQAQPAVAPAHMHSHAKPAAPEKVVTKKQAYAAMKERITKFDFRALAKDLPV